MRFFILTFFSLLISTPRGVAQTLQVQKRQKYLIDSISKWAKGWEKKEWTKSDGKPVQNIELIKKIYYLVNNLNIKFLHQRSHKAPPKDKDSDAYFFWDGNDKADRLAQ